MGDSLPTCVRGEERMDGWGGRKRKMLEGHYAGGEFCEVNLFILRKRT